MKIKVVYVIMALVFFAGGYYFYHSRTENPSYTARHIEQVLHDKEQRLNQEISRLQSEAERCGYDYAQLFMNSPEYYNALYNKQGMVLLIYENDSLKFWTDNSIPVENWRTEICLDTRMAKLPSGWFEVMKSAADNKGSRSIIGLILIKNEFPYQNKYLVNTFHKSFNVSDNIELFTDTLKNTHAIRDVNGTYLFSLKVEDLTGNTGTNTLMAVFFNLLGFLMVLLSLKAWSKIVSGKINIQCLMYFISIITLRYLSVVLSFPRCFYEYDLFNPTVYADSSSVWLGSLGDLLINVVLLFVMVFHFVSHFNISAVVKSDIHKNKFAIVFSFFWILLSVLGIVLYVVKSLVQNSNISFSVNNVFNLNMYSYLALIIVGLLLLMCFLLTDKLLHFLSHIKVSDEFMFKAMLPAILLHVLVFLLLNNTDYVYIFAPVVMLVAMQLMKNHSSSYSFTKIVILVFVFSLYAEYVFTTYTNKKEVETRKILAQQISDERDPVAEFLFDDIDSKLKNDTTLIALLSKDNRQIDEFEKRLNEIYFSGFWDKYDVRFSLYDSMCFPLIKPQSLLYDNNLYFEEMISKKSIVTSCSSLYFLNNASGKTSYLASFSLFDSMRSGVKPYKLYIEMEAKINSSEIGYPELLLDQALTPDNDFENYSYVKFRNNKIVHSYGKFPYTSPDLLSYQKNDVFCFHSQDGFNHLLYRPDDKTLIIMSKKEEGLYDLITTFSYLFTFFSFMLLLLFFVRQLLYGSLSYNLTFKYRIQLLLVSLILTSLLLFGGGTIYYIQLQFKAKEKENISEKIRSVSAEISNKLGEVKSLHNTLSEYSTFLLKKSSNVFFTDINLYDSTGELYASSRPKIFDKGLTSKKMNAEAYLQMCLLGKQEFTHNERIGNSKYLSSYVRFNNKEGKLLGYINLPYFARQNELKKEISFFLVALINIYVLLFVLSIVLAVVISTYITKPLKLIQDKIGKIQLGKFNEPIEWKEKDEIGNLVSEYNRMIAELSKSADLLAKSERESAWREMAKQVAHEIKNPLTPMKLGIQHLQRLRNDNSPDFDQKVKQLCQTIIEQIDTLSNIATEFSNFAKMPKANLEKINLQEVISGGVQLFKDSENLQLQFNDYANDKAFVMADKEQLLRVFNNLLKNAVQSFVEGKKGVIQIDLKKENNQCIVNISDNGSGISDEHKEKIFVPNFTTKSGGTGLGLAMVKNIVESINGGISFKSIAGEGTTFTVTLPCIKTD